MRSCIPTVLSFRHKLPVWFTQDELGAYFWFMIILLVPGLGILAGH